MAHDMLEDYARSRKLYPKKKPTTSRGRFEDGTKDIKGMMYTQVDLVAGTNGRTYKTIQCHSCKKWGHYASHCPEQEQQHLNLKEVQDLDNEEEQEEQKPGHMQLFKFEVSSKSEFSDSDSSYILILQCTRRKLAL